MSLRIVKYSLGFLSKLSQMVTVLLVLEWELGSQSFISHGVCVLKIFS